MEINLRVPTCWYDMKEDELEYLSRLAHSGITDDEKLVRCFIRFSGLKLIKRNPVQVDGDLCYLFKQKNGHRFQLDVERFAWMVTKLEYLVKEVDLFQNPKQIGRYQGCDYRIYGITLDEYLVADNFFTEYTETGEISALNNLVAVFYRKMSDKWNDGNNLDRWSRRFRHVPLHRKHVVYLWYTGVKSWIISKYPFVFPDNSESGPANVPQDGIIMGLLSSLNNQDVTRNAVIKATEVHEVLYELNKRIETAQSLSHV